MQTAKYNQTLQRGQVYSKQLTLLQPSGDGFDLTGYTASAYIRSEYTDATPVAVFTCSIDVPLSGTMSFALHPSSSILLTGSCYLYDVRITSGSDVVHYPLEGKLIVSPVVTR